jgi:outer membrane protein insertion porin family
MRACFCTICFWIVFLCGATILSADEGNRVSEIRVSGNQRIEADAILRVIETRAGGAYDAEKLSKDLEAIYKMGYFDDIRVEVAKAEDGQIVIFEVREKPTIREILFSGNRAIDNEKITENIDISTGSILNIYRIQGNIRIIETLYREKNYHNVRVTYDIHPLEHNQANLEFVIDEGEKVRIREIRFDGNQAYSDKELKKLMETSEKGFFSWLTSSGELDQDKLAQDIMMLTAHYHNNGYADARVGDPVIDFVDEWIQILIKIDEGDRYAMGTIDVQGDYIIDRTELLAVLESTEEAHYNRDKIRQDVLALTDIYADRGYARADVMPEIQTDPETATIDIVFHIEQNEPVYFEKIVITGNTKTRDKVIRRELHVHERNLFSSNRLKRSIRNLHRLDFFENVDVQTNPGSQEDQMILQIDVAEKPTGTFTFGGGYSGVDKLYIMGSISERNLFGRGQYLEFRTQAGSRTQQFSVSFVEPWLFDIPLSAGVDIYNWNREYDEYDRDSTGGSLRFGYPILDYTRGYIRYAYDISDISNVVEDYEEYILEERNVESSVSLSLVYDSRNQVFNPSDGSNHKVTLQHAGLGGNVGFTKLTAETGWYYPLFWSTVFFAHGEMGYVWRHSGKDLPDYERFYLGGIDSLRGFDWREVSPVDEDGLNYGGDRYIQFNLEYLFPIIKDAGFMGLFFYDAGNAYDGGSINLSDMRESAGFGIRWYSPMGPLRLERGYILDRKPGEDSGRWEFTIGGFF